MSEPNRAQIDLWDGRVGEKWAAMQVSVDAMLAHATAALKARAGSVSGQRVLDIGCGAGETCTIWLDGGAEVTGVDVSAPMLAVAADRTGGQVTLVKADAAVWTGEAPFDLAVSQFGLMFFADPDLAFTTIAANVRPGGRLLFTCWRAVAENQWVSVPMGAIRDLLPPSPPPVPHAPGPFALADRDRLRGILERAGFTDVAIAPFDFPVCLARDGGVEAAVALTMQIGPTGSALVGASKETLALARERLRAAFAPHDKDGLVTLGGAVWLVEAVRPLRRDKPDSSLSSGPPNQAPVPGI
jgi:SAM-dependent methyltransferase